MNPIKILETLGKLKESQPGDIENVILVEGIGSKNPVKIGKLFGCEVWANPNLPPATNVFIMSKKEFDKKKGK